MIWFKPSRSTLTSSIYQHSSATSDFSNWERDIAQSEPNWFPLFQNISPAGKTPRMSRRSSRISFNNYEKGEDSVEKRRKHVLNRKSFSSSSLLQIHWTTMVIRLFKPWSSLTIFGFRKFPPVSQTKKQKHISFFLSFVCPLRFLSVRLVPKIDQQGN